MRVPLLERRTYVRKVEPRDEGREGRGGRYVRLLGEHAEAPTVESRILSNVAAKENRKQWITWTMTKGII